MTQPISPDMECRCLHEDFAQTAIARGLRQLEKSKPIVSKAVLALEVLVAAQGVSGEALSDEANNSIAQFLSSVKSSWVSKDRLCVTALVP